MPKVIVFFVPNDRYQMRKLCPQSSTTADTRDTCMSLSVAPQYHACSLLADGTEMKHAVSLNNIGPWTGDNVLVSYA